MNSAHTISESADDANISISETAVIHPWVDIQTSTRGTRITIGDQTHIDAFVKIKPTGGPADVTIGARCHINSCTVIYSGNGVTIGDDVLIGPNVSITPINHRYEDADTTIKSQGYSPSKGGVFIGDDVCIGAGCTILDGSIIERGAVIGAGSLVLGRVEANSVYYGAPARPSSLRRVSKTRGDKHV